MSLTSNLALFIASLFVVFSAIFIIGYSGTQLSKSHGSDIRIVWYLFSLALTSTFLIAWWASSKGAIDASGNFHGTAGELIQKLLTFMLDIEADLKIVAGLGALVLFPQFLSYVFSGFFGCAAEPILVGSTFRFLFWTVVKSFVVAAGILFVVAGYGWVQDWNGLTTRKAVELGLTALLLVTLSFALLHLYRDLGNAVELPDKAHFARVRSILRSVNAWANRRATNPLPATQRRL